MTDDAYKLPEGHVAVAFSGGRTSAYMLHELMRVNGGLPEDRVVVSFQNTGAEDNRTLDFVQEVGERFGAPIVWLEYRATAPHYEVVGHNSASRNHEPFEALIERQKFLPNVVTRFCTTELKIRTQKRYLVNECGWRAWTSATGIRADEPRRLNKDKPKDRWTIWNPLAAAGVTKADVLEFWQRQPFDLQIDEHEGNCVGCFLKSERKLYRLTQERPAEMQWWEGMEKRAAELTSGSGGTFNKSYSRRELREWAERQGELPLSSEDALCQRDGGECM